MEIPVYETQPEVNIFFSEGGLRTAGLYTVSSLRESLELHRHEVVQLATQLQNPSPYNGFCLSLLASILNLGISFPEKG